MGTFDDTHARRPTTGEHVTRRRDRGSAVDRGRVCRTAGQRKQTKRASPDNTYCPCAAFVWEIDRYRRIREDRRGALQRKQHRNRGPNVTVVKQCTNGRCSPSQS